MTTPGTPIVLVGVDGSEHSLEALDFAADEAVLRDAELRVVGVITWPVLPTAPTPESGLAIEGDVIRDARSDLDTAARRAVLRHPDLRVTTQVRTGVPAGVLVSESTGAELLVVGPHGRGGFAELVTGSVTTQVATSAHCPVVVAHRSERDPAEEREGPVVVGVDASAHSRRAVEFAFDEASRRGVDLLAVLVWSEPLHPSNGGQKRVEAEVEAAEAEAARVLADAVAPLRRRYPGLTVRPELVSGASAEEALVQKSAGAALVVVGARRSGELAGPVLGSVGEALIRHAACPVAIVRAEDDTATDG